MKINGVGHVQVKPKISNKQYNINIGALYWTKEDENCWTYQGCEKDRMNKKSA